MYEQHRVRTVLLDGEPWLVAADVCAALGLRDTSSALKMVDPEDVRRLRRSDTPQFFGGIAPQVQEITVVNESGVYALIFQSRKPEARQFKRWVTHDLIPSVLKAGRYEISKLTHRELAQMVIDEADRADAAEALAAEQSKELDTARPKAEYVDAFVDGHADGTPLRVLAGQLNVPERALRDHLLACGRIYRTYHGRRWSKSDRRYIDEYQYNAYAKYRPWFVPVDLPKTPRLPDGQMRRALHITPVGKVRIRNLLRRKPLGGEPPNIRPLPLPNGNDTPGGAA
jgi:prophage antirepressor-like protein